MTNTPIVLDADVDILDIPRRGYSYNQGDRRFTGLEDAVTHGYDKATKTGVRQVVRREVVDSNVVDGFWLVQAVGS